jgi:hypothetical protein
MSKWIWNWLVKNTREQLEGMAQEVTWPSCAQRNRRGTWHWILVHACYFLACVISQLFALVHFVV